ncbi:MAG: hypothetical protein RL268_181 [Pseudomonadota bacterium]|jgi:hypothetical protein
MTDAQEALAKAWNQWWNSVSTGANDKHMQTAFGAGYESAIAAILEADLAELRAQSARIERLSYALGCIANEDWTAMTAEDARREAREALASVEGGNDAS